MELKLATASCIQFLQPTAVHHSCSSQPLVSAISSQRKKSTTDALIFWNMNRSDRLFGRKSSRLSRTQSCEIPKSVVQTLRRSCSASLDSFSDRASNIEMKFRIPDDDENCCRTDSAVEVADSVEQEEDGRSFRFTDNRNSQWFEEEIMIPESIKRKASRFDLPVSLRIIKKKRRWHFEAGESDYCSVRKAFSSMVFIIGEMHSYTLQMRDILPYEDLQSEIARVQKEIHASFVWLFRQVFSPTPSLMLYLMILLSNFTVSSMANYGERLEPTNFNFTAICETVEEIQERSSKTCTVSSKSVSVGGSNGGEGKIPGAGSGMGDEDKFEEREEIPPDCARSPITGETLNQETIDAFVAPESEDYLRTELTYQMSLSQDPDNPLLLANYAQFLYVVARDYDRADEYFKKAVEVRPVDAEAYSKYAAFLWMVKKDLWAAEEAYLEAIAADPSNSYYAGNYAHFLWNTGGEDTCYPLGAPDNVDGSP